MNTNKRGAGTLKVVIIIAVLLTIALLFRQSITSYARTLMGQVFNEQQAIDIMSEVDG